MLGTSVPVASVDEGRYLRAPKDKIGRTRNAADRPLSHEEPKPKAVHGGTQGKLWPSVALAVATHDVACLWR